MVSDAFRDIEDRIGSAITLQADFIAEIAHKITQEPGVVEHLIYKTSVAIDAPPHAVAVLVNEFLVHLNELGK